MNLDPIQLQSELVELSSIMVTEAQADPRHSERLSQLMGELEEKWAPQVQLEVPGAQADPVEVAAVALIILMLEMEEEDIMAAAVAAATREVTEAQAEHMAVAEDRNRLQVLMELLKQQIYSSYQEMVVPLEAKREVLVIVVAAVAAAVEP